MQEAPAGAAAWVVCLTPWRQQQQQQQAGRSRQGRRLFPWAAAVSAAGCRPPRGVQAVAVQGLPLEGVGWCCRRRHHHHLRHHLRNSLQLRSRLQRTAGVQPSHPCRQGGSQKPQVALPLPVLVVVVLRQAAVP